MCEYEHNMKPLSEMNLKDHSQILSSAEVILMLWLVSPAFLQTKEKILQSPAEDRRQSQEFQVALGRIYLPLLTTQKACGD